MSILLATTSVELEDRIQRATSGHVVAIKGPLPDRPEELLQRLVGSPVPEVVVLDAQASSGQALGLAAGFAVASPGTSVLLVSDLWQEIGMDAMRAGVLDIVHPAAEIADIQVALERAERVAQLRGQSTAPATVAPTTATVAGGRVISVVSPKGGVGKTTVSTNLAVGLARSAPQAVVLVDLDIQFGDVANALNLQPEYQLPQMVRGDAARDTMVLKTYLTLHPTGLYVVCGPESPIEADGIDGEMVGHLLDQLAAEFRFVVVDTSPGLSEHTLVAMDHTTDLVLLTSMDVHGVRGLRKELDTLDDLEMFADARHIVLNFAENGRGLSTADVRASLGTDVDLVLPVSRSVPASVNQGIPLLQSGTRGPVTKELAKLVERFAPPAPTGRGRHRRSWVGAR
ncbi:AAA family ATPase [Georgenia thermotolerans]|uniref:AAA family ATPase n=1 Tax=Georgenia thermotolerans TaxID=527326 RepID=A0A7J5UTD9_9MICO|nr:AAA family ATPase [Georgenia thermotolerans]KAE8765553.1 AAA family ATPase [Georgenia thermotolerans]